MSMNFKDISPTNAPVESALDAANELVNKLVKAANAHVDNNYHGFERDTLLSLANRAMQIEKRIAMLINNERDR